MSDLSNPGAVMAKLMDIEADLAARQLTLERAALAWFHAKRQREREYAEQYLAAEGTVEQRKAQAAIRTATLGVECEAEWEALKAVVRVLETRSAIGMSLLKSQGRVESNVPQPHWSGRAA